MDDSLLGKIKPLRLLILDVDATLTDGLLYYGNNGEHLKAFHVHDGLGIHLLQKAGLEVAIITAKDSAGVALRMQDLKIKHVFMNCADKRAAYNSLKQTLQLQDHEIAYVGDDLIDLPVMKQVGFSIAVKNAVSLVQHTADYITQKKSGRGAVREVCELILQTQHKWDAVIQQYLI